jgi:type IV secretory pathway VirB10-like protein
MAADESLKRLGGGRWETRDGRFAIEPQSGTWVVVDTEQTDELGLPLVRGPFATLTAAKAAIDGARTAGPAESPLADRLRQAREASAHVPKPPKPPKPPEASKPSPSPKAPAAPAPAAEPPEAPRKPPEAPREPAWLLALAPAGRRRARDLIRRLEALDVADAESIARAELTGQHPAVARLALEGRLRQVLETAETPREAVRAVIDAILAGSDAGLGVRWRLVDDQGRPIDNLNLEG